MKTQELETFSLDVSESEGGYLRFRTGPSRRNLRKCAENFTLDDASPLDVELAIQERCQSLSGQRVWIEHLKTKSTKVLGLIAIDVPLVTALPLPEPFEKTGHLPLQTPSSAFPALVQAVVRLAADANRRADNALALLQRTQSDIVELAADNRAYATREEFQNHDTNTARIQAASEVLKPVMPVIAAKLGQSLSPEKVLDQMLVTLQKRPELVTKERALKLLDSLPQGFIENLLSEENNA